MTRHQVGVYFTLFLGLFAPALAVTCVAKTAHAQPTTAPSDISPPRLKTDSPAKYPDQALADHVRETVTVDLILDVDATGRVKKATIETPRGHGFDEAAASASSTLIFDPAIRTKTNEPLASKIRFSYTFEPPPVRIVGRILRQTTRQEETPIEGATVTVRDVKGVSRNTTTGADGSFRIEGVPFGKVHIHVEAKGRKPADVDDDLAPGEEANVSLRLAVSDDATLGANVPPPQGVAPGETIEEVRVRGERPPREVTKRTIPREEIAVIPGTNGDAIRSITNLPGVARPPPFGGQLVVRGSAPQDTNYFVDGTNIPLIYHFGGLSSVLPTEVLDKIDFYPGNFGTQYGRGMGGIIDVGVRAPKDDGKLHGMAQIDFIDARVVAERSLGKGWSVLVGGRRSYFDLWLGPILESSAGVSTAPRYYDYQVMVRKEFAKDHDLRIFLFGSDDRLEIFSSDLGGDFVLGGGIRAAISFWRLQARYNYKVSSDTRITATAAVGEDFVDFGFGPFFLDLNTLPISTRAELSHRMARWMTVNVGVDILHTPYEIGVRFPRPSRPGVPGGGLNDPALLQQTSGVISTPGVYTELEVAPIKGTRIVPGVRVDHTNKIDRWDVSPRISIRQDLTSGHPRTTAKGGVGMYYQPPQPVETDDVFGQANLKTNRAVHYSVGLEQEVGQHVEVSVESFYKKLDRLVVQDLGNSGDGRVYGTEWLIRWKNDAKMFGWFAYTLMRSERRDSDKDNLSLFEFDQTHILTAILSREFNGGWRVGGRFRLVSGNLYTPNNYGALDLDRATYDAVSAFPLNSARLGAFHQLDFRIDKTLNAKPLKLTAYLDIQNVYFHRSQEGVSYNFNYTRQSPVLGLPILPILGLRGEL